MKRPAPARFPKTARVRSSADYARVFAQRRRTTHPALVLHRAPAPAGRPRLGLAVSRKVDPRARVRNRIKRVLRETFRRLQPQLAPLDLVVVARAPAATLANAQLSRAFTELLQRCGALPATDAAGTMRAQSPSSLPRSPERPEPSMPQ
ncbi:ribonuclease P protein component [Luteimonas sp. e5]